MRKLFVWLGIGFLFYAVFSLAQTWTLETFLPSGFLGAVLLIVGLAGVDEP